MFVLFMMAFLFQTNTSYLSTLFLALSYYTHKMYLLQLFTFLLLTNLINAQNNTVEEAKPDCDVSELQIDSFQLSAFVHNYAESGLISDTDFQNLIFLPKKVYDTGKELMII